MIAQKIEPRRNLSKFIKCYWTLEGIRETIPEKIIVVPDGCIKILFHYGDLYSRLGITQSGKYGVSCSKLLPRSFVLGQLTQPIEVQPTGKTGILFVCFHPNGFYPFSTIPIKSIENTTLSLDSLFREDGIELQRKLLTAGSTFERITIVESFFEKRLSRAKYKESATQSTVEAIFNTVGNLPVNELSRKLNVNRRQLLRIFNSTIGLSPKQLSKTIRLQAALKVLLNKEIISFTSLAHEINYYDQAHLVKDFKEFTGLTPGEFYKDHLRFSMIFENQ